MKPDKKEIKSAIEILEGFLDKLKKHSRCPQCGYEQYCPCKYCKDKLPKDKKPWRWIKGELIKCINCGYTLHADGWLDIEDEEFKIIQSLQILFNLANLYLSSDLVEYKMRPEQTIKEILEELTWLKIDKGKIIEPKDKINQALSEISKLVNDAVGEDVPRNSNYDYIINATKAEIRQSLKKIGIKI